MIGTQWGMALASKVADSAWPGRDGWRACLFGRDPPVGASHRKHVELRREPGAEGVTVQQHGKLQTVVHASDGAVTVLARPGDTVTLTATFCLETGPMKFKVWCACVCVCVCILGRCCMTNLVDDCTRSSTLRMTQLCCGLCVVLGLVVWAMLCGMATVDPPEFSDLVFDDDSATGSVGCGELDATPTAPMEKGAGASPSGQGAVPLPEEAPSLREMLHQDKERIHALVSSIQDGEGRSRVSDARAAYVCLCVSAMVACVAVSQASTQRARRMEGCMVWCEDTHSLVHRVLLVPCPVRRHPERTPLSSQGR